MTTTKVKLLRPLDGKDVGDLAEYPVADAQRLAQRGAVEIVAAKAASASANKAAPPAKNKAAPARARKGA